MHEAVRKLIKFEEYDYGLNIKVTTGVAVRISTPEMLLEDLHENISPLIASVRGQSDLVTTVEAWTYKPSNKHRGSMSNNKRIVKITAQEKIGKDLAAFIEEAKTEQATSAKVDLLAHFVTRFASMIDQRGLIAPTITPNTILSYDGRSLKLNGGLEGALSKANDEKIDIGVNSTYVTSIFRINKNHPEFSKLTEEQRLSDEMYLNEFCSLGMTLIQVGTGTKLSKFEARRKSETERQREHTANAITSLLQQHPSITSHLKVAVMMLRNKENIDIVLSKETFVNSCIL